MFLKLHMISQIILTCVCRHGQDGRIWKERVAIARRRMDMVKDKDGVPGRRRKALSSEHVILPSLSAPEHVILKYLE